MKYTDVRKKLKAELILATLEYTKMKRDGSAQIGSKAYQDIRIFHVAYSLFRGKPLETIEGNYKHPESWLNKYVVKASEKKLAEFQAMVTETETEKDDETVCPNS